MEPLEDLKETLHDLEKHIKSSRDLDWFFNFIPTFVPTIERILGAIDQAPPNVVITCRNIIDKYYTMINKAKSAAEDAQYHGIDWNDQDAVVNTYFVDNGSEYAIKRDFLFLIYEARLSFASPSTPISTNEPREFIFNVSPEIFTHEETQDLNYAWSEVLNCYGNDCFVACVSLCGKVIETVVASIYKRKTGKYPREEDPDSPPSFASTIKKLKKEHNFDFPDNIEKILGIVSDARNEAIHANLRRPSPDETRGVLSFTREVLVRASNLSTKTGTKIRNED